MDLNTHSKSCVARAMIDAIESYAFGYDDEEISDFDFRVAAQNNDFLVTADSNLKEYPDTCKCHVFPVARIRATDESEGASAAAHLADAFLNNGEITFEMYTFIMSSNNGY